SPGENGIVVRIGRVVFAQQQIQPHCTGGLELIKQPGMGTASPGPEADGLDTVVINGDDDNIVRLWCGSVYRHPGKRIVQDVIQSAQPQVSAKRVQQEYCRQQQGRRPAPFGDDALLEPPG